MPYVYTAEILCFFRGGFGIPNLDSDITLDVKVTEKWKKALLRPDQTIRDGLEILDRGGGHIALVTDHKMVLMGVVTDGDIRRAILRGTALDSSISEIMNTAPITASSSATRNEIVQIMEQNQILVVPIVTGSILVGLETLLKTSDQQKYSNTVFLMAGGFGTRLRPMTNNCPKPMLKVGGKPILEIMINNFKRYGFFNFYISLHYLPNKVIDYFGDGKNWDVNIRYIYENDPLGTGGALGLLPDDIEDKPIVVSNADLLTQIDFEMLIKFHEKHQSDATMCVRDHTYQVPFGVVTGDGNNISDIVEKPSFRHFVNAGIYVINKNMLQFVSKNEKITMPELFQKYISNNRKVLMFPMHEYWLDIGRLDDFERAQKDILGMRL